MKKYKLILNFTMENEKIIYFDKITRKKLELIANSDSYILLSRDNYYKIFYPIDFRVSEEMQRIFNEDSRFYCRDYKGVNNEQWRDI